MTPTSFLHYTSFRWAILAYDHSYSGFSSSLSFFLIGIDPFSSLSNSLRSRRRRHQLLFISLSLSLHLSPINLLLSISPRFIAHTLSLLSHLSHPSSFLWRFSWFSSQTLRGSRFNSLVKKKNLEHQRNVSSLRPTKSFFLLSRIHF